MEEDVLALAERFFAAVARGDIAGVREIYATDAEIWHNYDGSTQDVEQNLRVLAAATSNIRGFRYEEVRRQRTDHGFVQQHVLRGNLPGGGALDVPACIVCTVKDGRITRLEEYFDSAHIAGLVGPGPSA